MDRIARCEVWSILAHDYGLYGIASRLEQMGFKPGPEFKEILQAIEEAQLDGRIKQREEALAFVRSNYSI